MKTERLLKIYALLKQGPVTIETVPQLARKNDIKISERTFYRDLEQLEISLVMSGEKAGSFHRRKKTERPGK